MFASSTEGVSTTTAFPLPTRRALDRIGLAFASLYRTHLGLEHFRGWTLPLKLRECRMNWQGRIRRYLYLSCHELRNGPAMNLDIPIGRSGQCGGIRGPNFILHISCGLGVSSSGISCMSPALVTFAM